tara:strand:+ start:534 stop:1367 length:834 start_codon:yes stop_codon:yes gene_type:complete
MDLSFHGIEKEIKFLHNTILKKNISIPKSRIFISSKVKSKLIDGNYTTQGMQKVSDYIAKYLGIVKPVRVEIFKEKLEHPPGFFSQISGSEKAGLYKVDSIGKNRVIKVYKKAGYNVDNILAILAHENVHNFMYEHSVGYPNEDDNEKLTDLLTTYLGFGDILFTGYKDITISSIVEDDRVFKKVHKIGYITSQNVYDAMYHTSYIKQDTNFYPGLLLFDKLKIKWKSIKSEQKNKIKSIVNCEKCNEPYYIPKMSNKKTLLIKCKKCGRQFSHKTT